MSRQPRSSGVLELTAYNAYGKLGRIEYHEANRLGSGATAVVYQCSIDSEPAATYAIKIYNQDRTIDVEKISAMLEKSPLDGYKASPLDDSNLLCWPIALVKDKHDSPRGILMPLVKKGPYVPLDYYYDSVLSKKLKSSDETALSFRLEIALNLSKVVDQLHSQGHHFIDFKPQNIWVSQSTHKIVFLDCDGFSICGLNGERYPADLISTDYISPEAFSGSLKPRDLGEQQDLYALAVIIFQLINYGAHPFQGVVVDPSIEAATNDEKAYKGLYPNGVIENSQIQPRPASTHKLNHRSLRKLFDKAFTSTDRPNASQWSKTIQELLEQKSVVRCRDYPSDPSHMRFRALDCPECYRQKAKLTVKDGRYRIRERARLADGRSARKISSSTSMPPAQVPLGGSHNVGKQGSTESSVWLLGMVISLVAVVFFGANKDTGVARPSGQASTSVGSQAQSPSLLELERIGFLGTYALVCNLKYGDDGYFEHVFFTAANKVYWAWVGNRGITEYQIDELAFTRDKGRLSGFHGNLLNTTDGATAANFAVEIADGSFRMVRYVNSTTNKAVILNGFILDTERPTTSFRRCR